VDGGVRSEFFYRKKKLIFLLNGITYSIVMTNIHIIYTNLFFFFFLILFAYAGKFCFLLFGYFRILYRFLSRIAARFIAFCSSMYIVTALIVRQRVHELGRKADNFLIVTFTVFVSVGRKRNRASACTAIKWYQGLEAYSRELLLNRINR